MDCSIEGCDKPTLAKTYCAMHYQRLRKYGDPLADFRRKRATCRIDGCERPAHGQEMCRLHWERARNHGDPLWTPTKVDRCMVTDCTNRPRSGRTPLCEMHYYRMRRNGHMNPLDVRIAAPLYRAAHSRIERDRGAASAHACADCGMTAEHWSYDHSDPSPLYSGPPYDLPYSLDVRRYQPRCRPCHKAFDAAAG